MKKDPSIRNAIDESLCSIRFNAQDERSVLRRVRAQRQEEEKPRVRARKRGFRPDFAFAMGMVLILVIPLTIFTLRAGSVRTQSVVPLSGTDDIILSADPSSEKQTSAEPAAQASAAPVSGSMLDESAAIRAARDCYNAVCDTSVFSFEEFTVTCTLDNPQYPVTLGASQYVVVMESIYGNGCTFEAAVDAQSGDILSHSDPEKATVPDPSALESEKAQAWYNKNGSYVFKWSSSTQAEFSRRYEGATLREPKDGEISFAQAAELAQSAAASYDAVFCYPMLFSERAEPDGVARYRVFCFTDEATEIESRPGMDSEERNNALPANTAAVVVLNAATGAIESVRAFDAQVDAALMKGLRTIGALPQTPPRT